MKKSKYRYNWPLIGNKQITDFLSRTIDNGRLGSTYIFNGPDNLGKTTLANHFAKIILCQAREADRDLPCGRCGSCKRFQQVDGLDGNIFTHSDYYILKKQKDKKNISIAQVRELIRALSMSSFMGDYKVGVIKHADTLSTDGANALLKTLEEPKNKVIIILITQSADNLPATIVSRSQVLEFKPVAVDIIYDFLLNDHKASRSTAKNLSRLSQGRPALALKFMENKEFYDRYLGTARVFIDFFKQNINDRFIAIDRILGGSKGQEAVVKAGRSLEVWQGVLRDLLLINFDQMERLQHQIALDELKQIRNNVANSKILSILRETKNAFRLLDANVNPRMALEYISILI